MLIRHRYYEFDTLEEFRGVCLDHFGDDEATGWVICGIEIANEYKVLELSDRMAKEEAEKKYEEALSTLPTLGYVYVPWEPKE